MDNLNLKDALTHIMSIITTTNKYFHDSRPWELAKSDDIKSQHQLWNVIYNSAESLRIASILLQPFMPERMSRALDMLGVAPQARTWDRLGIGRDFEYGTSMVELGERKDHEGMLFPPLTTEWA